MAEQHSDVEFLPAWYPGLRRSRRVLIGQVCLVAMGITLAVAWVICAKAEVRTERATLTRLAGERARLRDEDQVLAKLGRHVEALRVLGTIDRAMPAGVALTETSFEVESAVPDFLSWVGIGGWRAPQSPSPAKDDTSSRGVRVRLRGTAPTAVEAANFVAALSAVPFFRQVAMTDAKETADGQRLVSEFQVTFGVSAGDNPAGTESGVATNPALVSGTARAD